jgi:hypothetical protein
MAKEGGIEMLISLLDSPHELIQRQSAKALANLGVNADNKRAIALKGVSACILVFTTHCHQLVRRGDFFFN